MTDEGANPSIAEKLAVRAQAGCEESFEQLVRQYHQQIYHFLFQMTRNVHDAEDLTQETFIKACQHVAQYNPKYRFSTWLFTIARNSAITHFRKKQRLERNAMAEWEQLQLSADQASSTSDHQENIWIKARELKPKRFEALWLHYHEGFSVRETAAIMNANSVYIKVLLHRARKELGTKLNLKFSPL